VEQITAGARARVLQLKDAAGEPVATESGLRRREAGCILGWRLGLLGARDGAGRGADRCIARVGAGEGDRLTTILATEADAEADCRRR
jgi:hypothetical protein